MKFSIYDKKEFEKFLNSLSKKARTKVLAQIKLIEEIGLINSMMMNWVKKLDNNLYEIRCEIDGFYPRALFFRFIQKEIESEDNTEYIITNGFSKKTNKTPKKEINKANKRRLRYIP